MWRILKNVIYRLFLFLSCGLIPNCLINAIRCSIDNTDLVTRLSVITSEIHDHNTFPEIGNNIIENLNEYLKPFGEGDCLIHLINHKGIDFLPFEYPVVLSRYTIISTQEFCTGHYRPVLFGKTKHFKFLEKTNEEWYVKGIDKSSKTRWTCLATFDIYPVDKYYYKFSEIFDQLNPFWRKRENEIATFRNEYVNYFTEGSIHFPKTKATAPTYTIFVFDSNESDSKLWKQMKTKRSVEKALIQIPKSNAILLKTNNSRAENISLVCYYCNKHELEEVPLVKSLESRLNRKYIDEKFATLNKVNNGVPVYLHLIDDYRDDNLCYKPSNKRRKMFEEIKSKLFSDIPQLKMIQFRQSQLESSLEMEELVDREISRILFGNLSFTLNKYDPYGPSVQLKCKNLNNHLALVRTRDEYTFITCGLPKIDKISFNGFVAAFDKPIWIFTLLSFWIASVFVVISAEENLTKFKLNICITKSFFLGLRSLLEQGDDLLANGKRKTAIRWIVGTWILMAVIIVNAYKGENITSLTSPRAPIPITNFSQLLNYKFKIYSKSLILITRKSGGVERMKTNNFEKAVNDFWWQIDEKGELAKVLKNLLQNMTHRVGNPVKEIRKCNDSAMTDWTEELEVLSQDLKQNSNESNRHVFVGKEIISYKVEGWLMEKWVNPNIPIRMDALVFSGIIQRWEELRKISRILRLKGSSSSVVSTPQDTPTKLSGNVATVFVIYGICIVVCLLGFLFEIIIACIVNIKLLCLLLLYFKRERQMTLTPKIAQDPRCN